MALLRVIHAAGLPDPGDLIRRLSEEKTPPQTPVQAAGSARAAAPELMSAPRPSASAVEQAAFPADFGAFVDFVEGQVGFKLAHHLRDDVGVIRSEEHTSELQSLMRISYAVFCLKKKTQYKIPSITT